MTLSVKVKEYLLIINNSILLKSLNFIEIFVVLQHDKSDSENAEKNLKIENK